MTFKLQFTKSFLKSLDKLDKPTQKMLIAWIEKNLSSTQDPRLKGKPLQAKFKGLWCYRIGVYRIICDIRDEEIILLFLEVGYRKVLCSKQEY